MKTKIRIALFLCTLVNVFIVFQTTKDVTFLWKKCSDPNKCGITYGGNNLKTKHLAFLKVPKTGSSTLQNIIFRFGLRNNLQLYIPDDKYYLSEEEQQVIMSTSVSYDIFMIHTVYNTDFFRYFPTSESASISLIRNPVDRFISAAYYMRDVVHAKYLERIPKKNYIQNLLGQSEKYDRGYFSPTRNLMGKYFGFTHPVTEDDAQEIKQYLDKVNSEILLVLILERFDESLVLLKHLLEWSFSDILYLKLNSHSHEPVQINDSLKEKLKTTSFLDHQIYGYFYDELERKIERAGPSFPAEVKHFRDILRNVTEYCSSSTKSSDFIVPESIWDGKFAVSPDDCMNMMTNDIDFFKKFKSIQERMKK